VRGAHYTLVTPEPVLAPAMVAFSAECASLIGLDPAECASEAFTEVPFFFFCITLGLELSDAKP
jgi:hypothetical protein